MRSGSPGEQREHQPESREEIGLMKTFRVIRDPAVPYQRGSDREAAWQVARRMNGAPVDKVLAAWVEMEQRRGNGTRPQGWIAFFCGPSRTRDGRTREVLAEVVEVDARALAADDVGGGDGVPEWARADEAKAVWDLARDVFGPERTISKLRGHLEHLKAIQGSRRAG
jgi:hypothetical protein